MWKTSCIILLSLLCVGAPAWSLGATIEFRTAPDPVPPGSLTDVEVYVSTADQIGALQFLVEYNSVAATFVSAQLGSDLVGKMQITNVWENIPVVEPTPGTDSNIGVQIVGSGVSYFTGNSMLVVLTFRMADVNCAYTVITANKTCQYTHLSTINPLDTICNPIVIPGSLRTTCTSDAIIPRGRMQLLQNVPNPFNPSTTITFEIAETGTVHLKVFDVKGHLVRTLLQGTQSAGLQSVVWDGKDNEGRVLAAGTYFYQLSSSEGTATRRTLLLK